MARISAEEKRARHQANEDVFGTHAMEGLFPDDETRALFAQYAEGDLSAEELSAGLDAHVEQLLTRRDVLAGAA